jgi:hypothetical protein
MPKACSGDDEFFSNCKDIRVAKGLLGAPPHDGRAE